MPLRTGQPSAFSAWGRMPAGTEVSLVAATGSVVLPLHPSDAVQRGTVWSPFNQPGATVSDLVDASAAVTDVRIERLS